MQLHARDTRGRFSDDNVADVEVEEADDILPVWIQSTEGIIWRLVLTDKTIIMTNNPDDIQREIMRKRQRLEEVKTFKYLCWGSLMKDPNPKYFPGLPREQPIFLDRKLYGGTKISNLRTLLLSSYLYA